MKMPGMKMPEFHQQLQDRLRSIQLGAHVDVKRPSDADMLRIREAFNELPNLRRVRGEAAEEAAGQLQVIHNLLLPFEPAR